MARLRRPMQQQRGLFERSLAQWLRLGVRELFDASTPRRPAELVERVRALIERGDLTRAEVERLDAIAHGDVADFGGMTPTQAQGLLRRWRGPIRGLKLTPLPHWPARWRHPDFSPPADWTPDPTLTPGTDR